MHLISRGLIVTDPKGAAKKIEELGYERLRIYFLSRRTQSLPSKPFLPGITFQNILKIYECDVKLREICFIGVGHFELAFRNRLSEELSLTYGAHPYFEKNAFKNLGHQSKALQTCYSLFNKTKDPRAKHYREHYSKPSLPPIWTFKEFLTFGAAASFYNALSTLHQSNIAAYFGVNNLPVFKSWLQGLVDLRNICAHHDRLFNRHFQKQPRRYNNASVPSAEHATLKAQLECLDYVLNSAGLNSDIVQSVEKILNCYSEIKLLKLDFDFLLDKEFLYLFPDFIGRYFERVFE